MPSVTGECLPTKVKISAEIAWVRGGGPQHRELWARCTPASVKRSSLACITGFLLEITTLCIAQEVFQQWLQSCRGSTHDGLQQQKLPEPVHENKRTV